MIFLLIFYCQIYAYACNNLLSVNLFFENSGAGWGGGEVVGEEVADFILILSVKSYSHFLYIS